MTGQVADDDKNAYNKLTQSQKESAYFNMESNYDPMVYENTPKNWAMIFGMFGLFYFVQAMHWWCNYALGIHATDTSSVYNLIVFGSALFVIGLMLYFGSIVNQKKLRHEYYAEKISEEKIKIAEKQAKMEAKAKQEAKRLQTGL